MINSFNGYDKAREFSAVLSEKLTEKQKNNVVFMDAFNELSNELLEYRRQHNIFEVGDWIVIDSYKPEYQFYQINKDDMGSHWINLVEFRHATDEEIEVGHRL